MTRTEALATITAQLDKLDDTRISVVAEMVATLAGESDRLRPLTSRELALIEQSKDDFANGRTLSTEEAFAQIDAGLTARRAARTTA